MERAELSQLVVATGRAVKVGDFVFLHDPAWGDRECREWEEQRRTAETTDAGAGGWLCVPTGGSSGRLRFARHDERTVTAAVSGFCAHFGVSRINAVGVLPSYHVSGLMARVRCAATRGAHVDWAWKRLEAGDRPPLAGDGEWFLSVVPTQLQRLLADPDAVDWLRRFRAVFVGGGPSWPSLNDAAAAAGVPVSLSYGMTETAAMIAALRPEEFAAGARSSGAVMPHARVEVVDEETGVACTAGATGLLRISGESVFRGYFPKWCDAGPYQPEDIGFLDTAGRLTVVGRRDAVIITGGKKVHPGEVEDVLRASGLFADVAVIGVSDAEWGQAIVACHPIATGEIDAVKLERVLAELAPYKRPKRIVPLDTWPRNEQGKVNRAALLAAVGGKL